jgi:hypothetical protein
LRSRGGRKERQGERGTDEEPKTHRAQQVRSVAADPSGGKLRRQARPKNCPKKAVFSRRVRYNYRKAVLAAAIL